MIHLLERLATWAYAQVLTFTLLASPPDDEDLWQERWTRADLQRTLKRELAAIRETVIEQSRYQDREARILSERLSRRYDVAQAVNEAANRAMQDKAVARAAVKLTPQQEMALELQKATVQERIRNS